MFLVSERTDLMSGQRGWEGSRSPRNRMGQNQDSAKGGDAFGGLGRSRGGSQQGFHETTWELQAALSLLFGPPILYISAVKVPPPASIPPGTLLQFVSRFLLEFLPLLSSVIHCDM